MGVIWSGLGCACTSGLSEDVNDSYEKTRPIEKPIQETGNMENNDDDALKTTVEPDYNGNKSSVNETIESRHDSPEQTVRKRKNIQTGNTIEAEVDGGNPKRKKTSLEMLPIQETTSGFEENRNSTVLTEVYESPQYRTEQLVRWCEWSKSVGIIVGPKGVATGFLVRDNKVFVPWHFVEAVCELGHLEVTKSMSQSCFKPLREVYIIFGYISPKDAASTKYYLNPVVHFKEGDIALLEIQVPENASLPMPFEHFSSPSEGMDELLLIGCSKGEPVVCQVAKIKNLDSKQLQDLKIWGMGRTGEANYSGYEEIDDNMLIFQSNLEEGASGSVGITFLADGQPTVVTVLLKRCPSWAFDKDFLPARDKKVPEGHFFNLGPNMGWTIHGSLKSKDPDLYAKLCASMESLQRSVHSIPEAMGQDEE